MVFAPMKDQAVGIVEPMGLRREMELGTETLVVGFRGRDDPVLGVVGVRAGVAAGFVALHDLIHADVAPPMLDGAIHDADPRLFPLQILHVPMRPGERMAPGAGGPANGLAVDHQGDESLSRQMAAADQEVDVAALDRELGGEQCPLAVIPEGIHQAVPLESGHRLLARARALGRRCSEDRTVGRPGAVVRPFEVGDDDVGSIRCLGGNSGRDQKEDEGGQRDGPEDEFVWVHWKRVTRVCNAPASRFFQHGAIQSEIILRPHGQRIASGEFGTEKELAPREKHPEVHRGGIHGRGPAAASGCGFALLVAPGNAYQWVVAS